MRHAKSSWDDESLADFDRPLNARGRKAAAFMGEFIYRNEFFPDAIFVSPAARTRETAEIVRDNAGLTAPVSFDERIYEASPLTLRLLVAGLSNENDSALIIGHNPGMEHLQHFLTGRLEGMPTAAFAVIDLDIDDWAALDSQCGKLRKFVRPKEEMRDAAI